MAASYFDTTDGEWFRPTDHCRGPWDAQACHAGPPVGLMVRAMERLEIGQRIARITVDLIRPIPMAGFAVRADSLREGRSVSSTYAEIVAGDRVVARAHAIHLRTRRVEVATAPVAAPDLADAVAGPFPITETRHGLPAFPTSLEVRYDPEGSQGNGGPTTIWVRALPLLPDEEPSGAQRICPLADSGNGISYNGYLDRVLFVNPDLTLALHREPVGDWFGARVRSHWEPDGIGLADADLFDTTGHVGRAIQTLLLDPVEQT